jgi:uncharacterized protein involved in type VI secretion and phage assembly
MLDTIGVERSNTKPIDGVVIGKVTNNKDPENRGRVKLNFPWYSDTYETDFVYISTLMAGPERGTYFLPEVKDIVLVAFEHGDIHRPYVIGSIWNGADAPPANNQDGNNNIRKIRSRSGHEFIFNDEKQKEKIEIHTKEGHRIILDDTGGKEKVEISDKSGDNSILIDSTQNSMTISSKTKLSIKAQSIEIEAGGMMTIKASGTLTIQGSLVKIN